MEPEVEVLQLDQMTIASLENHPKDVAHIIMTQQSGLHVNRQWQLHHIPWTVRVCYNNAPVLSSAHAQLATRKYHVELPTPVHPSALGNTP